MHTCILLLCINAMHLCVCVCKCVYWQVCLIKISELAEWGRIGMLRRIGGLNRQKRRCRLPEIHTTIRTHTHTLPLPVMASAPTVCVARSML